LNDPTDGTGDMERAVIRGLRLLPVHVTHTPPPDDRTVTEPTVTELKMYWMEEEPGSSFSLTFSNGQVVFLKIEDNTFDIKPQEMSHILYDLGHFVNAQLFVQNLALRLVGTEHWWTERGPLELLPRSRQTIFPSVLEQLLQDVEYQPHTGITRPPVKVEQNGPSSIPH
jgi:hypothetical protein